MMATGSGDLAWRRARAGHSVVHLAAGSVATLVAVWACWKLIQRRNKAKRCVLLFAVQPGYAWAHSCSCRARQVVGKIVTMSPVTICADGFGPHTSCCVRASEACCSPISTLF
jgi:hypothetical protein